MAPADLAELFRAIANRDLPAVARLLNGGPALGRQAARDGATRTSASAGWYEAIGHYAYAGDTALHLAAAAHAPEIVRDLLARGADVRARNRRGAEPLHYAADGGPGAPHWAPEAQAEVLALLIGAGGDPNAADKSGVGPLHRAVRTRCAAAVRALLDGGAAPRRPNASGSTPLHLAVQGTGRGGSGSPSAREQQAAIIGLLLDRGARPSDRDAAGKTVADCVTADWIRALLTNAQ